MDIAEQINAADREVRGRTVLIRRGYVAEIEDVWQACTDPERISRWFLPVSGDLRLGGRYQLEGNAGGEILRCEPPKLLRLSWIFGESTSYVQVRLDPVEGGTMFELEHSGLDDEQHWDQFGPGAVGVGWDLTILGLGLHVAGLANPEGWGTSPEAYGLMTASAVAWGEAHEKAGEDPVQATAAAERTAAAYVPKQNLT
ncbi:SRPBCC family protein [Amycolatopsis acidiphila]|nr:SRPBCC family protein [Amycolatopsis acidiphila]UIJ61562.1 SRPBCC family protein [Amycolatopsis acidiphila]GHG59215.1 activator of HSP90 ATPase [Amycolatopsis acidiphila]